MSENDEQRRRPLKDARRHHYEFAHLAVRAICLQDPLRFFAIVASDDCRRFVDWIWSQVCASVGAAEEPAFSSADIAITTHRVGGCPTVVVAMPRPEAVGEAHLVAIVLTGHGPETAAVRYFTLECGLRFPERVERTVLCEWTGGGHSNFGDGPRPEVAAFLQAVESRIRS